MTFEETVKKQVNLGKDMKQTSPPCPSGPEVWSVSEAEAELEKKQDIYRKREGRGSWSHLKFTSLPSHCFTQSPLPKHKEGGF